MTSSHKPSGSTTGDTAVEVAASTAHSIWVDVTWTYHGGAPDERNMNQLVRTDEGGKIAVPTPLEY
ncbi:MAG: hypothetical protein ACTMH0_02150 [Brevibacterium linens]